MSDLHVSASRTGCNEVLESDPKVHPLMKFTLVTFWDSLIDTPAKKHPNEERGVIEFYKSESRRCRGFVGNVQIRKYQVLLRNKASKIALKSGSVDRM